MQQKVILTKLPRLPMVTKQRLSAPDAAVDVEAEAAVAVPATAERTLNCHGFRQANRRIQDRGPSQENGE